jgi:hypothetical protein
MAFPLILKHSLATNQCIAAAEVTLLNGLHFDHSLPPESCLD